MAKSEHQEEMKVVDFLVSKVDKDNEGDLCDIWKDPGSKLYWTFIKMFGPRMVGFVLWNTKKCKEKYGTYVTILDEALAVLAIENGIEKWKHEFDVSHNTARLDEKIQCKYQAVLVNRKKKSGPWTDEGKQRFNDFMSALDKMRKTQLWDETQVKWISKFKVDEYRNGGEELKRRNEERLAEQGAALQITKTEFTRVKNYLDFE